jgi:hypothetical protein
MQTGKDRLPEERRSAVRHPHTSSISFTTLGNSHNLPNDYEKLAETVDISRDGVRINISAQILRVGSMLKVRMSVSGSKDTIPVLAEVIWVKEKKPENYQAGLRFLLL